MDADLSSGPMRSKKRTKTQTITEFDQEAAFAYAYLKHMGNATAAAREAFNIKSDSYAGKKGYEMVRKSKVQKLIHEYLDTQRKNLQKFADQSSYYLMVVAERLCRVIQDEKTPFDDLMRACDMLARFAGRELSEKVVIAQIEADAKRPLPVTEIPKQRSDRVERKVLFMLSPPPMPPGEVPTPALEKQWREAERVPGKIEYQSAVGS